MPLSYHKCTDEDFDSFYPPSKSYINMMALERKLKNLYCLDNYDDVTVFGEGDFTDY